MLKGQAMSWRERLAQRIRDEVPCSTVVLTPYIPKRDGYVLCVYIDGWKTWKLLNPSNSPAVRQNRRRRRDKFLSGIQEKVEDVKRAG